LRARPGFPRSLLPPLPCTLRVSHEYLGRNTMLDSTTCSFLICSSHLTVLDSSLSDSLTPDPKARRPTMYTLLFPLLLGHKFKFMLGTNNNTSVSHFRLNHVQVNAGVKRNIPHRSPYQCDPNPRLIVLHKYPPSQSAGRRYALICNSSVHITFRSDSRHHSKTFT